jgi:hypothetical protein
MRLGSTLTAIVRGGVKTTSALTHTLLLGTNGKRHRQAQEQRLDRDCLIGGAGTDTFTVPSGNGTEVCILNAPRRGAGA